MKSKKKLSTTSIITILLVGFMIGVGTPFIVKMTSETISASIGSTTNKDSFGIGSWFRYDYATHSGISQFYVVTNITGITTSDRKCVAYKLTTTTVDGDVVSYVYQPVDPYANNAYPAGSRWYIWSISVYYKATDTLVYRLNDTTQTNNDGMVLNRQEYQKYIRCLMLGYQQRTSYTAFGTGSDLVMTVRPMMPVEYTGDVKTTIAAMRTNVIISKTQNNIGDFSLIDGMRAFVYDTTMYDEDTGILLGYGVRDLSNTTSPIIAYFTLTDFSAKNPIGQRVETVETVPTEFHVENTGNIFEKTFVIDNFLSINRYIVSVASSNESVFDSFNNVTFYDARTTLPTSYGFGGSKISKIGMADLTVTMTAKHGFDEYGPPSTKVIRVYVVSPWDFVVQTSVSFDVVSGMSSPVYTQLHLENIETVYNGTIFVKWMLNSQFPATRYKIYIKVDEPFNYVNEGASLAITVPGNFTRIGFRVASTGIWYVRMAAVSSMGNSDVEFVSAMINLKAINVVGLYPNVPPYAPVINTPSVINERSEEKVSLLWSTVPGVVSYRIYRSVGLDISSKESATMIKETSSTSFVDILPMLIETRVWYAIESINSTGESPLSSSMPAFVNATLTRSPTTFVSVSGTTITWVPVSGALEYIIYVGPMINTSLSVNGSVTSYNMSGYLPDGNWNVYIIVMTSDDFQSVPSNVITITVIDQEVFTGDQASTVASPDYSVAIIIVIIVVSIALYLFYTMYLKRKTSRLMKL